MHKHWRILALGALVSGAAIYMIAAQIDFVLLGDALRTANYWMLIPGALIAAAGLAARAMRWRVLLSNQLGYVRAFHILNIAYLLNGLLPFRMGELARVWLARRGDDGVPYLQSAGTIVLERVLDLLVVVLFIVGGLVIAEDQVPAELRTSALGSGVIALLVFGFMVIMAARREWAHSLLKFAYRVLPFLARFNFTEWLDHTLDGLKPLTHWASLLRVLLWTAISWGFSLASGYVMMLVFYPQGDVVATLLFIAAASFAVALPAIPGNVGPYEGSIIFALGALGYTSSDVGFATATAFAFSVHFINLAVNAVLGVIGFIAEGVSLAQISKGVQQLRAEEEQEQRI